MGHGGTKVQVIKPASAGAGVSQGDSSPSQASKPTSETNQSQALDAGRLSPGADGMEQSQGLSLPMVFPSEASGQSIESASAGLAARMRRDKRVARVATGLLQEEGKRDSTHSAVAGRRASQSVMPEMLDPELESFLTKAFQKHFLLKSVAASEYKALSLSMKVKHAVADEVIVSQGDQAESVYFIRHGTFALSQDSVALLKTLGPGDSFGELALLYSVPSSTTITAVGSGELWKLERQRFLECKEKLSSSQMEKALEFFQACQDFRYLKEDDQKSLAAVCTSKSFEDGNPIVMHNEEVGDFMFIVISGQVSVGDEKSDTFDRGSYGKPGSVIGSVGVIYNKEQVGGAFAKGTVECLCLNKASLSNFSASVIDVLRRAAFKAILHSLPRNPLDPEPWRILSEQQVNMLISRTEDGTFEAGEIVFAPDDGAQLIIVVTGEVAVTKHPVKTRVDGDLVFFDEPQDIRNYADKVIPSGHCYGKQPEFLEGVDMSTYGIAMGRVRLHRILHSSVQELLGDSLMEVMRCAEIKRVLSDIFLFKNLNEGSGSREDEDVLSSAWSKNHGEVCGARLRTVLQSVEGLSRLLFSTLMLCWNIRRVLPDDVEEHERRRLSFQEWTEINAKIEADGTTPSIAVQKCIYNALLQDECLELLPETGHDLDEAVTRNGTNGSHGAKGHVPGPFEAEGVTLLGWASIPSGGLERYELVPNGGHPGAGLSGAKLSHSILSEASLMGAPVHEEVSVASPEAVWMCLKHKAWLFLSTAPEDSAPYAFIRLQEAVLRETDLQERSLVLAGRKKLGGDGGGPFGDGGRFPLQLCFLLADGRFQPFEAVWLQLQFPSDEELQSWSSALGVACCSDVAPELPSGDGWI